MTIGGFCTLSCLLPHSSISRACSGIVAEASTSGDHNMVCCSSTDMTFAPSSHCQTKSLLYAAGLVAGGALIGYVVSNHLAARRARCNNKINLGCEKVADSVDIEDIGEKKVFCRCWKSDKFPYCDGSHGKHNKATGDNVGPLIVKGKPAAQ